MHIDDIKLDQEFQALFSETRLSGADREHLRNKLLTEGFHDPLVLWDGVLLDGYTRLELCREEGIEPATRTVELRDREHAIEWIRIHQHSRRNLDAKARALNIAEVYSGREKRQGHRSDVETSCNGCSKSTAAELADELGVSERTVHHAVEYKRGLDAIEEESGPEAREEARKLPMKAVREKGRKAVKEAVDVVAKLLATVRNRLQSWPIEQRKAFVRGLHKVRAEFGI